MNRILTLTAAAVALTTAITPAQAYDGRNTAFALGALTGLVMAGPRPAAIYGYGGIPTPVYAAPPVVYVPPSPPVYYAPPPVFAPPIVYTPPAAMVYPRPFGWYR